MDSLTRFELPSGFDWQHWVERYDRMQNRLLVRRADRYSVMVHMIRRTQDSVSRVYDLGCGTGSLTLKLLEAFPETEVHGIDFDPTLMPLAKKRLANFSGRFHLVVGDLRDVSWSKSLPKPVDAVVSATALHWLSSAQLTDLYRRIAEILRPGGIFLNADHVGSDSPLIQKAWEEHREGMRQSEGNTDADRWSDFWNAYARVLNLDIDQARKRVNGGWEGGVEDGMPLAWHFDQLRAAGFGTVDCFWRCDCDAVYGGIRC